MEKKLVSEIKKIVKFLNEHEKTIFYMFWGEEDYTIQLNKKVNDNVDLKISTSTGDYIIENIRSLDNSFKANDLIKELENEGYYI